MTGATTIPAREITRRYVQFCLVGGTGVAVDMAVLYLLASPSIFGLNLSLSKTIAAEVAIWNNFVWNDLWTFRDLGERRNWRSWAARLAKFNLICLLGIGLSVLLLNVQVYRFGLNVYLANFISIVVASVWNYLMNARFGWNVATLH